MTAKEFIPGVKFQIKMNGRLCRDVLQYHARESHIKHLGPIHTVEYADRSKQDSVLKASSMLVNLEKNGFVCWHYVMGEIKVESELIKFSDLIKVDDIGGDVSRL